MNVSIYTSPTCQPCRATKRLLDREGVSYAELDASEHREQLLSLGHTALPVVVAGGEMWSGFRPDLLAELASTLLGDDLNSKPL